MSAKEVFEANVHEEEAETTKKRISVRAHYLDDPDEWEAAHADASSGKSDVPTGKSKDEKPKGSCKKGSAKAKREGGAGEESSARGKSHNRELGERGEEAAARFLMNRGYDIIERNWSCPAGEVDIIAEDGDTVVFVEVKTRSNLEKGLPSEAVNDAKRSRYERIAAYFLSECNKCDFRVRFDVVGILVLGADRALIRHHINAFSGR